MKFLKQINKDLRKAFPTDLPIQAATNGVGNKARYQENVNCSMSVNYMRHYLRPFIFYFFYNFIQKISVNVDLYDFSIINH